MGRCFTEMGSIRQVTAGGKTTRSDQRVFRHYCALFCVIAGLKAETLPMPVKSQVHSPMIGSLLTSSHDSDRRNINFVYSRTLPSM